MTSFYFDRQHRFVIEDYADRRPFASFLPGIAGPSGIPLWVFYTNRGQAIAGFGIEDRDNPIMEFQPANKAYQTTPLTGFRTFIKVLGDKPVLYEPFAPWEPAASLRMAIGMNTLELRTESAVHGIRTTVTYFTLSDEPFAGLVRQVQVTNVRDAPLDIEMLDGLPWVQPYGVDEQGLKMMGRTLEAWKGVFNVTPTEEGLSGVPFYRFRASAGDTSEVTAIEAGHFYLAFREDDGEAVLLPPLVDPDVVFGPDTSLHTPRGFLGQPLAALQSRRQITTGKTPCGFFGTACTLAPGESVTLHAIIGHMGTLAHLQSHQTRIARGAYLEAQRKRANALVRDLTDVIETETAEPRFDAYCRQTFLDNVLRGGWPLLLGDSNRPHVYHVYSRKHGDMERDYNAFYLAAEMYSQGNGNYRDVAQNRRLDVFFEPRIGDFNVLSFLGLIQADGYNPLVVLGQRFTLAAEYRAEVLALVERPDPLAEALAQPFTPGGLLRVITDRDLGLKIAPADFVTAALTHAEAHFEAEFGEGYWIDHWFYNLDLIDSYLALYPDRKRTLLFEKRVPYFQSPAAVQPRDRQYVLTERGVRRYHAIREDERTDTPDHRLRTVGGEVYRATVFEKLCALALLKFATLDPWGMGVEMEAGRPGWYDALNGLPGLIGSSLCESYELLRLLDFLLAALAETPTLTFELPLEQADLLETVCQALATWKFSDAVDRDLIYWDAVATARERYRARIRRGFAGEAVALDAEALASALRAFRAKAQTGIDRALALNDGTPPTYFAYEVTEYETLDETDDAGRPYVRPLAFAPHVLPLFLEGPVHALKVAPDAERARQIHVRVRESALYDRTLGMVKVNASLADESHELGRCRAFTPGWLENESIWLHMEYKYLLELLKAGLYREFFADFKRTLIPFLDPATYGRSPLENSSFLVSSAHPDESLHGRGFVARLSGSTAEFLSIWCIMMVGPQPFRLRDGRLYLVLEPALPGWLFREDGTLTFTFLGHCTITYHNPAWKDTFDPDMTISRVEIMLDGQRIALEGPRIDAPYAERVRDGSITRMHVFFDNRF
ncbi:MAG: cellobiose phosphorylase [Anaerolineae bacterium]